jgi:hypothetical protein
MPDANGSATACHGTVTDLRGTASTTPRTCQGRGHHTADCYGRETLPCPGCAAPVSQSRLQCGTENPGTAVECNTCLVKCTGCVSEVHGGGRRIRVVHSGMCSWLRRYQAGQVQAKIPCGVTFIHWGPCRRAGAR